MNDFISGADNLESAQRRRYKLISLLKAGGFTLKTSTSKLAPLLCWWSCQWTWPSPGPRRRLLSVCSASRQQRTQCNKEEGPNRTSQDLWPCRMAPLAPVTVVAKMAIQDLWRIDVGWDEPTPEQWTHNWLRFQSTMKQVGSQRLPRWVGCNKTSHVQLHAFANASRWTMAVVVYCRSSDDSQVTTSLLWAKTKLTPLKSLGSSAIRTARMTIPRLELRAALLAARLTQFTAPHLDVPLSNCYLWSDSQVVLHWLCSDGPTGHDFVDNYMQHIQELVPDSTWRHVLTADNPVDAATRDLDVASLGQFSLWWRGPSWLTNPPERWPLRRPFVPQTFQENSMDLTCLAASLSLKDDTYPIERFSSLTRMLRTMTRWRRIFLRRGHPETALPLSTIT